MDVTEHLHLTKDAETDFYSVSRVNANSDRIDAFAGDVIRDLAGKAVPADITRAVGALNAPQTGGSGKYLTAVSETGGVIAAAAPDLDSLPAAGSGAPVMSGGVWRITDLLTLDGVRNYLPVNAETITHNGVTYTVNADGSVTANGTAGMNPYYAQIILTLPGQAAAGSRTYANAIPIRKGTYTIPTTGIPGEIFYSVTLYETAEADPTALNVYNVAPVTFTVLNDTTRFHFSINTARNQSVNQFTFLPMIRRAEIADNTFVPYAPDNRTLYEMIRSLMNGGDATCR